MYINFNYSCNAKINVVIRHINNSINFVLLAPPDKYINFIPAIINNDIVKVIAKN
jgi:hypothetical protein